MKNLRLMKDPVAPLSTRAWVPNSAPVSVVFSSMLRSRELARLEGELAMTKLLGRRHAPRTSSVGGGLQEQLTKLQMVHFLGWQPGVPQGWMPQVQLAILSIALWGCQGWGVQQGVLQVLLAVLSFAQEA